MGEPDQVGLRWPWEEINTSVLGAMVEHDTRYT
jgi:hypothetical protein